MPRRTKRERVAELLELAIDNGIWSSQLNAEVITAAVGPLSSHHWYYATQVENGEKINAAGLAAQINYLYDTWRAKKLRRWIEQNGSTLDRIVRDMDSTPEKRAHDIGADNVDSNGIITSFQS